MKKKIKRDELLDIARSMPPLYHKIPEEDFDWDRSETLRWLLSQPEVMNYIWQCISNRGRADKLIVFDQETRKWHGIDYGD